jgi:hypothetical protein
MAMKRRLKISAESKQALRLFLSTADVDFGCRPIARQEGGRISILVDADDDKVQRISARADTGIVVEVLELLPAPETRRALVATGNRFLAGELPRGVGIKE